MERHDQMTDMRTQIECLTFVSDFDRFRAVQCRIVAVLTEMLTATHLVAIWVGVHEFVVIMSFGAEIHSISSGLVEDVSRVGRIIGKASSAVDRISLKATIVDELFDWCRWGLLLVESMH